MLHRRLILNFHALGEPPAGHPWSSMWLAEPDFAAMLDAVAGRRDVTLTFDDGRRSDLEAGVPALRTRGLEATFFIIAGRLGEPDHLDVEGVRELCREGMGVGSHGLRHRPWRELSDAELDDDLAGSRARLEEMVGAPVTSAACPLGVYDRRVLRAARRAGYERVYTSDGGWAREGAWLQPRNTVVREGASRAAARLARSQLPYDTPRLGGLRTLAKRWR